MEIVADTQGLPRNSIEIVKNGICAAIGATVVMAISPVTAGFVVIGAFGSVIAHEVAQKIFQCFQDHFSSPFARGCTVVAAIALTLFGSIYSCGFFVVAGTSQAITVLSVGAIYIGIQAALFCATTARKIFENTKKDRAESIGEAVKRGDFFGISDSFKSMISWSKAHPKTTLFILGSIGSTFSILGPLRLKLFSKAPSSPLSSILRTESLPEKESSIQTADSSSTLTPSLSEVPEVSEVPDQDYAIFMIAAVVVVAVVIRKTFKYCYHSPSDRKKPALLMEAVRIVPPFSSKDRKPGPKAIEEKTRIFREAEGDKVEKFQVGGVSDVSQDELLHSQSLSAAHLSTPDSVAISTEKKASLFEENEGDKVEEVQVADVSDVSQDELLQSQSLSAAHLSIHSVTASAVEVNLSGSSKNYELIKYEGERSSIIARFNRFFKEYQCIHKYFSQKLPRCSSEERALMERSWLSFERYYKRVSDLYVSKVISKLDPPNLEERFNSLKTVKNAIDKLDKILSLFDTAIGFVIVPFISNINQFFASKEAVVQKQEAQTVRNRESLILRKAWDLVIESFANFEQVSRRVEIAYQNFGDLEDTENWLDALQEYGQKHPEVMEKYPKNMTGIYYNEHKKFHTSLKQFEFLVDRRRLFGEEPEVPQADESPVKKHRILIDVI